MNFVSPEFFVLLGAVLLLLPFLGHRHQNILLLVASLVFYGWWNWRYLGLMIGISTIDYVSGWQVAKSTSSKAKRWWVVGGLSANLAILVYFKYIDFLIQSLNSMLTMLGAEPGMALLNVVLPIAISFHTFQSMSYLIDVYRGELKPERNFLDYQLFVSFFPVLVAGPIERGKHLLPQITQPRRVTLLDIHEGVGLIVLGFFKKVVIADNLSGMVDRIFSAPAGGGTVVLGTYAFALQIYGDFSGYTDIARGVSRLMGFHLMDNFRQPYFATNPSDFWRRWHVSLSSWLRDYLYIPLGGNRHGAARTYLALTLTMVLGGLWHGASWTFLLWGAYHALLLIGHRLVLALCENRPKHPADTRDGLPMKMLKAVFYFQLTCIGWLLFRAQNWTNLSSLVENLFRGEGWFDVSNADVRLVLVLGLMVLGIDSWCSLEKRPAPPLWIRYAFLAVTVIAVIALAPENLGGFIYFQF